MDSRKTIPLWIEKNRCHILIGLQVLAIAISFVVTEDCIEGKPAFIIFNRFLPAWATMTLFIVIGIGILYGCYAEKRNLRDYSLLMGGGIIGIMVSSSVKTYIVKGIVAPSLTFSALALVCFFLALVCERWEADGG